MRILNDPNECIREYSSHRNSFLHNQIDVPFPFLIQLPWQFSSRVQRGLVSWSRTNSEMATQTKKPRPSEDGYVGKSVKELKQYLRSVGARLSGDKAALIERALLYSSHNGGLLYQAPSSLQDGSISNKDSHDSTTSNSNSELNWNGNWPDFAFPEAFNLDQVFRYLTCSPFVLNSSEHAGIVESGTEKPTIKGRQMYQSKRIQYVEMASTTQVTYFRGNVSASLKTEFRYPGVGITRNGQICECYCTCPAQMDMRCAHIAALLYCLEDISSGNEPKLDEACTSKKQAWGRGQKVTKDPHPVHQNRYAKATDVSEKNHF